MATLLDLVGQKRWGLPIVLLAAVVGFPPLYAVALLAGATEMRAIWFGLAVLVGRVTRFCWSRPGSTAWRAGCSEERFVLRPGVDESLDHVTASPRPTPPDERAAT